MEDSFRYLTLNDILFLHDKILEKSDGGMVGIIDIGSIEKTVGLVQEYFYQELYEKAGYMFYSITMNHGFVDGNKRTALFSTAYFLLLNINDISLIDRFIRSFEDATIDLLEGKISRDSLFIKIKNFLEMSEEDFLLNEYKELIRIQLNLVLTENSSE